MEQVTDALLERLLKEYPCLLDDSFTCSQTQARAVYFAGFLSCKDVFNRLRNDGRITPAQRVAIESYLNENSK